MKIRQLIISGFFLFTLWQARGQGTFTFDQQSTTTALDAEGGASSIRDAQLIGQSFTPALSSIGFVRLYLYDSSLGHNQGAVINIALRSDSIAGPIIGTSDSLNLLPNSGGYEDFFFSTPISIIPGNTYVLQPNLLSGDQGIGGDPLNRYLGGTAFYQGVAIPDRDLWFREGLVVPEPSTGALLLLGGALAWGWRRR